MNKLVRYWNQNRRQIIIIIAIIAFVFIMMQAVNNLLKQQRNSNTKGEATGIKQPNQSAITGQTVSQEITEENSNVIKQFVDYCNNKEIQNAYNLLSDDCKLEFDNNVNTFTINYFNKVFETKKAYSIDLWINDASMYTYKIKYYENNLLSTGGSNINENIEDYITVVKQNNVKKININNFIRKEDINKTKASNNIQITINNRKIYKDYEIYNISIKNNSLKTITLSEGGNDKDVCLLDKNNVKYPCFLSEFSTYSLTLKEGQSITANFKFNKIYDVYRKIDKVQFNNINLNVEGQEKVNITIDI